MTGSRERTRRGTTLVEVIIIFAVLAVVMLFIMMAIPRGRETARLASCEDNLRKIGVVTSHYDTVLGHLPKTPPLGEKGAGPLAEVLGQFGLGDLRNVTSNDTNWALARSGTTTEHLVREFVCPSDPRAMRGAFPAPVSYRANAGPRADGAGGPFAFGAATKITDTEESAGKDFTAAFAERLVGSGTGTLSLSNDYRNVPGPLGQAPCPSGPNDLMQGNAGSSWAVSDWVSTHYNHTLTPNQQPSCIATDGKTARIGASSAHEGRVNVLMLGGSVRGYSASIAPEVWRKFAGVAAKDRVSEDAP